MDQQRDIVDRLRTWAEDDLRAIAHDMTTMKLPVEPADLEIWGKLMDEAADEIERLRALVK